MNVLFGLDRGARIAVGLLAACGSNASRGDLAPPVTTVQPTARDRPLPEPDAPVEPPPELVRETAAALRRPLPGEPDAEAFDAADERGAEARPCSVRQLGRWVRVACPLRADGRGILDLWDTSGQGFRVVVTREAITHVFVERPGRTTTWYAFEDGVYELGLDTGQGSRPWFLHSTWQPRAADEVRRAIDCCVRVRAPGAPAGVNACFGTGLWGSPDAGTCLRVEQDCRALDGCLVDAMESR